MSRILLIDDELMFRETLRAALEGMGHEVTEAGDGRKALGLYLPSRFDLVITDLIMPEVEGIETIIELRKLNPKVKIIAMSGGGRVTSVDYLQIARQIGAKKILVKPFQYEELKAVIDEMLQAAE
jgi:CheY-like chemotaxis protein